MATLALALPLGVLLSCSAWVVLAYNRLVALRERAEGAWADIDAQLKRRHDLVPALVETVRGYAAHERDTLERVAAIRGGAVELPKDAPLGRRAAREGELAGAIRRLFALAEAYPELRASERFGQLQQQLVEVERLLQHARRYYNAVVRDLNTAVASFPTLLVARLFGVGAREFFELDDARQADPVAVRLDG